MTGSISDKKNHIFLGGAGSGKSELAVNFALRLAAEQERPVHLFDLDMTKPLFRSRDLAGVLAEHGVACSFQEQFMDAPTQVGGVSALLRDPNVCTVLDVGGDDIGARAVGWYSPLLDRPDTAVYYVLNAYRPWMETLDQIDETLGKILGVSHVRLDQLRMVSNPNTGPGTTVQEFLAGHRKVLNLVGPCRPICFACAAEELCPALSGLTDLPAFPLHLYFSEPWLNAGGPLKEGA